MKERELLEKAAQSAGIWGSYSENHPEFGDDWVDPGIWYTNELDCTTSWNPLVNDGDAFRLAVKLGLRVCVNNASGFSWIKNIEGSVPHGDDPEFATRLAIVLAAAYIAAKQKTD